MLDSRAPPGEKYQEQEAQAEQLIEEEAHRLLAETKLWRLANSAMWVAWGIVQAHVPGMPDFEAEAAKNMNKNASMLDGASAENAVGATGNEETEGIVSQENADKGDEAKAQAEQDADLFKAQDEEEFDYLAYANDRALFVWGDALRMGIVKVEDLPEELRSRAKIVEF